MDVDLILLIVLGVFLLLLVTETPVAFALAGSGALGIVLLQGADRLNSTLASQPFTSTANYSLAIIPMYILLGMFALRGRLAERAYFVASRLSGRLPGGLGIATVAACAGFGAVTGSSVATAATIGRLSVTEMRKHGYPPAFAAGIVGAAGTLGALIPPSVVLVFYGIFAGESIGRLLLAAIIPGILSAALYMSYVLFRAPGLIEEADQPLERVLASEAGDAGQKEWDGAPEAAVSLDEEEVSPDGKVGWRHLRAIAWIAILFSLVLAGIYTGQFTVIESGGLGALFAMIVLVIERAREGVSRLIRHVYRSLLDTASITSMAMLIVVGAGVMSTFLVMSGTPSRFTNWVVSLDVPPILVVIVLLLALIPLGMALETLSILIIAVPLVHPVVTALGFDGVWFAILFVKMIEIGLVTPPVGMNAYVVAGAARVPVEKVFRGLIPFVGVDLFTVGLLLAFPAITLWLPNAMAIS